MTQARNNLRYYRKKAGLTQEELSKLSGICVATISNLEKRGSQPSERVKEFLADALHVSEEELCGYDSPYTSCSVALPTVEDDYLCAYRIHPRSPYVFQVLHFNKKAKVWVSNTTTFIQTNHVKWWTDIPRLPDKA